MKFGVTSRWNSSPSRELTEHLSKSPKSHSAASSPTQGLSPVLCKDSVSLCGCCCDDSILGNIIWTGHSSSGSSFQKLYIISSLPGMVLRGQGKIVLHEIHPVWILAVLTCCLRTSSWIFMSSRLFVSSFSEGVPRTGECCFFNTSRRAWNVKYQN